MSVVADIDFITPDGAAHHQYVWEMSLKQCQGMGGMAAMAKIVTEEHVGWRIEKWSCAPLPDNDLKFK